MFALPQTATSPDGAILFQVLNGRWICAVLIDVDHPGRQVAGMSQGPTEEAFGRCSVTSGSEKEIDGLSRGIDRSIEVPLLAFHLDVRLIEAPALVGWLQMPPAALVQFGPVELDPPPDTAGADGQTSFCGNLTHLGKRKWVPQIPTHAPHDDVTWIMSPFEGIGCGNRHVSPYQRAAIGFSQRNLFSSLH